MYPLGITLSLDHLQLYSLQLKMTVYLLNRSTAVNHMVQGQVVLTNRSLGYPLKSIFS